MIESPEDEEPKEGRVGGPIAGSFLTTGTIQLIQVVIGVILARLLGPEDRGELAAVILWPTLMTTIGSLGLAQAVTYFAARNVRLEKLIGTTLVLVAAVSVGLIAIGLLVIPLALGGHGSSVVDTARVFLIFFVPLNLVAVTMNSILNGIQRFRWFQAIRLILILVTLFTLAAFAIFEDLSIGYAATAYLAGFLVAAVIALAVLLRTTGGSVGFERSLVKDLLGYGVRAQFSTSLWSLNERADQLVISIFLSATSLGIYVVAVTMTSLTTLVGFSFGLVAVPLIARLDDFAEKQRVARLVLGATLVASTAVSVPIFVLEPWLIDLLFGEEFSEAAGIGRVLLVAGIVFALNRVFEAVLQALGRPLDASIGEGLALAVTAGGLVALLPLLGIMGAAITSLVAYTASIIFLLLRTRRELGVPALWLITPPRGLFDSLRSLDGIKSMLGRR